MSTGAETFEGISSASEMNTRAETFDDFWTQVLQNLGFGGVSIRIHCAPPSNGVMGRMLGCRVLGVGSGVGLGVPWLGGSVVRCCVVGCWVLGRVLCWVGWLGRVVGWVLGCWGKVKKTTHKKTKENEKTQDMKNEKNGKIMPHRKKNYEKNQDMKKFKNEKKKKKSTQTKKKMTKIKT